MIIHNGAKRNMFTGIIEGEGTIDQHRPVGDGTKFRVQHTLSGEIRVGDSVALNGCCLTVESFGAGWFDVHVTRHTLELTNLADLRPRSTVNLERALCLNGRLDGHLVAGHIEGVGLVSEVRVEASMTWMIIDLPFRLARYTIPQGSITIDGVSLTIASLQGPRVGLALIPKTLELTNLKSRQVGDRVNLECDMIAKWVERLLQPHALEPEKTDTK